MAMKSSSLWLLLSLLSASEFGSSLNYIEGCAFGVRVLLVLLSFYIVYLLRVMSQSCWLRGGDGSIVKVVNKGFGYKWFEFPIFFLDSNAMVL